MAHKELEGGNTANPFCTLGQSSQVPWEFTEDHSVFPLWIQSRKKKKREREIMLLNQNGLKEREMIASS